MVSLAHASLAYSSVSELRASLSGGELSSVELLEHLLARVERRNPALNAIVTLGLDAARTRAREADAARARGESWGPLHGIPITIKDSIEVAGMPTTSGAPELAGHMPLRDADAAARLIGAGAIVFGKTNLPLYAGDVQSYNEVHGTTRNPWNVERVPGGSSGGAAAALAAGFTPLELGSDIGGSIRNPAHFCGVYGHKPSYGIVPGRGHIPGPPGALSDDDLGVLGPLARTPGDLDLALDILAGPSQRDAVAWRLALPAPRHARPADFRVAAWFEQPGHPVASEVGDRLDAAAKRIENAGVRVDRKARPGFDPDLGHAAYLRLLYAVIGAGFPPALRERFEGAVVGLDPGDVTAGAQLVRGSVIRHKGWLDDNETRQRIRAAWSDFFRDVDVLLCPVFPVAAFAHDHRPFAERSLLVDGNEVEYMEHLFWAGFASSAYLPATAVPVGRTRDGLPVGMQLIAPYLEDRTATAFAGWLEEVVGGFEPPPGFDD